MVLPIVEEIAVENPHIKVAKVNVEEQRELAKQFRVMSIQALFVMKDGKVVNSALGAMPKQDILGLV